MSDLYDGDIDDIDVYVGGMLESVDGPGPLFSNIIVEQGRDSPMFKNYS
jgi:dual oxidase